MKKKPQDKRAFRLQKIITRQQRELAMREVSQDFMDDLPFISWKKKKPAAMQKIYNEQYVTDLIERARQNIRSHGPLYYLGGEAANHAEV